MHDVIGDFVDRGPKIRETHAIVRPMVDSGATRRQDNATQEEEQDSMNFIAAIAASGRGPSRPAWAVGRPRGGAAVGVAFG